MDKLLKELEHAKADKRYLEKMVDRLNKEMENRIKNLKNSSTLALETKDEQLKDLYKKVWQLFKAFTNIYQKMQSKLFWDLEQVNYHSHT